MHKTIQWLEKLHFLLYSRKQKFNKKTITHIKQAMEKQTNF